MTETLAHVTVRILDREYRVACPADEERDLLASTDLLNKKMREIRQTGKVVGLDRIAVMAALNLANELLKVRGQDQALKNIVDLRIKSMRELLDSALEPVKNFAP